MVEKHRLTTIITQNLISWNESFDTLVKIIRLQPGNKVWCELYTRYSYES